MKMKNLSCQNFKLVWWIVLVSDKLIIKSLHAMCVYHRGKKRNSCPKMENQGKPKEQQQDNKKWWSISSHEHFQTPNPLFEQVNATFTASITSQLYKSLSFSIISNFFQLCPNGQIMSKMSKFCKLCLFCKTKKSTRAVQDFKISILF